MLRRVVLAGCSAAVLIMLAAGPAAAAPNEGRHWFSSHWGGAGVIAHRHTQNLCEQRRLQPGSREKVWVYTDHFGHAVAPPAQRNPVDLTRHYDGWLYCAPELDIWAHTSGPWDPNGFGGPNWLSIVCPGPQDPIDGGAGFYVSPDAGVAQVAGGFGVGHNGYWHYRFHNPTNHTVRIQLWAVCVYRGELYG
jgi:hypothetical protein